MQVGEAVFALQGEGLAERGDHRRGAMQRRVVNVALTPAFQRIGRPHGPPWCASWCRRGVSGASSPESSSTAWRSQNQAAVAGVISSCANSSARIHPPGFSRLRTFPIASGRGEMWWSDRVKRSASKRSSRNERKSQVERGDSSRPGQAHLLLAGVDRHHLDSVLRQLRGEISRAAPDLEQPEALPPGREEIQHPVEDLSGLSFDGRRDSHAAGHESSRELRGHSSAPPRGGASHAGCTEGPLFRAPRSACLRRSAPWPARWTPCRSADPPRARHCPRRTPACWCGRATGEGSELRSPR